MEIRPHLSLRDIGANLPPAARRVSRTVLAGALALVLNPSIVLADGVVSQGEISAYTICGNLSQDVFPDDYFKKLREELQQLPPERFKVSNEDVALLVSLYRDHVSNYLPEDQDSLRYFTETLPRMSPTERSLVISRDPFCGYPSLPSDGCYHLRVSLPSDKVGYGTAVFEAWIYPAGSKIRNETQRQADLFWGSADGKHLSRLDTDPYDENNVGHVTIWAEKK